MHDANGYTIAMRTNACIQLVLELRSSIAIKDRGRSDLAIRTIIMALLGTTL
jgi:hypothetical protein